MRRSWKRALGLGVISAAGYAAWRAYQHRSTTAAEAGGAWQAQPFPYPPQPRLAAVPDAEPAAETPDAPWVESADGTCPVSHPVKAKLASGIFHAPGGASYSRTKADRCYASTDAATADELRPAKR